MRYSEQGVFCTAPNIFPQVLRCCWKALGCQVDLRCDKECFGMQSTTRAYLQDLRRSPSFASIKFDDLRRFYRYVCLMSWGDCCHMQASQCSLCIKCATTVQGEFTHTQAVKHVQIHHNFTLLQIYFKMV